MGFQGTQRDFSVCPRYWYRRGSFRRFEFQLFDGFSSSSFVWCPAAQSGSRCWWCWWCFCCTQTSALPPPYAYPRLFCSSLGARARFCSGFIEQWFCAFNASCWFGPFSWTGLSFTGVSTSPSAGSICTPSSSIAACHVQANDACTELLAPPSRESEQSTSFTGTARRPTAAAWRP